MLKGLPASGKSTYARILIEDAKPDNQWKRVNKDDLRAMIDAGQWSKENESFVKGTQTDIVISCLTKGISVVVDDTNFAYEDKWKEIAEAYGADFEVKYFDTMPSVCIERDLQRGDKMVGKKVIMDMYTKYVLPNVKKPEFIEGLDPVYICDIDGTVAIMNGRGPYEWKKVGNDKPNIDVLEIINALKTRSTDIIFVSGRDEICREETMDWLLKYTPKRKAIKLFMRPIGDHRKDVEIKREIYQREIEGKYNVLGVFDDRDQVIELWRSLGLTTLQVNYGAF